MGTPHEVAQGRASHAPDSAVGAPIGGQLGARVGQGVLEDEGAGFGSSVAVHDPDELPAVPQGHDLGGIVLLPLHTAHAGRRKGRGGRCVNAGFSRELPKEGIRAWKREGEMGTFEGRCLRPPPCLQACLPGPSQSLRKRRRLRTLPELLLSAAAAAACGASPGPASSRPPPTAAGSPGSGPGCGRLSRSFRRSAAAQCRSMNLPVELQRGGKQGLGSDRPRCSRAN